jgi:hypothetical protein
MKKARSPRVLLSRDESPSGSLVGLRIGKRRIRQEAIVAWSYRWIAGGWRSAQKVTLPQT